MDGIDSLFTNRLDHWPNKQNEIDDLFKMKMKLKKNEQNCMGRMIYIKKNRFNHLRYKNEMNEIDDLSKSMELSAHW